MEDKSSLTIDTASEEELQARLNRKARRSERISIILPFVGLIFLIMFFGIASHGVFLESGNLENLINQCYPLTIIAVGAAFVYANGGMDMSLGAVYAISQLVMAALLHIEMPVVPAILLSIGIAIVCCLVTAGVHVFLNVPVFICSMCMMSICNGIVVYAVSGADIRVSYLKYAYLNSPVIKAIVLVMVITAGWLLFKYTLLGKGLRAIGGNAQASRICGINRGKLTILGFVVLGVTIGLSAVFSLMRTGLISGATGSGMNLNIMIAIVLGGFPLTGGSKCRLIAPVIGALMVTVLVNGIQILGFDAAVANLCKAILFLVIIALTYDRSKGVLVN